MKAEIIGLFPGIAPAMISAGAEDMKTSDQLPLTGNSTSPTLRNWPPDWPTMVSKTRFKPF
jgi:hypothetical protein